MACIVTRPLRSPRLCVRQKKIGLTIKSKHSPIIGISVARGIRFVRKIGIGDIPMIDERIEKLHVFAHRP